MSQKQQLDIRGMFAKVAAKKTEAVAHHEDALQQTETPKEDEPANPADGDDFDCDDELSKVGCVFCGEEDDLRFCPQCHAGFHHFCALAKFGEEFEEDSPGECGRH